MINANDVTLMLLGDQETGKTSLGRTPTGAGMVGRTLLTHMGGPRLAVVWASARRRCVRVGSWSVHRGRAPGPCAARVSFANLCDKPLIRIRNEMWLNRVNTS